MKSEFYEGQTDGELEGKVSICIFPGAFRIPEGMAAPVSAIRPSAMEAEAVDLVSLRYEALIRLADSIRAQRDSNELFCILVQELSAVIPFDAVAQFDQDSNKVNWYFCEECKRPSVSPAEFPKEESIPWWVYERQRPVVIPDVRHETRFAAATRCLLESDLNSFCAVPLSSAHRRLGSLAIASQKRDAYSEEDVRFLSLVADQIALAMDDAFNFRASERAQGRLQLLLDLTNRVVANLDLRELLREISGSIRRVMQCEGVGVTLPAREDGRLRIYALDFPAVDGRLYEGFEPSETNESHAATVFRTGEPMEIGRAHV